MRIVQEFLLLPIWGGCHITHGLFLGGGTPGIQCEACSGVSLLPILHAWRRDGLFPGQHLQCELPDLDRTTLSGTLGAGSR